MPEQFVLPTDNFRGRYKYILMVQRIRRPLAICGIGLALLGLYENLAGLDVFLRPANNIAVTHPTTTFAMVVLCAGLINYSPNKPTPAWRYMLGGMTLLFLLVTLAMRAIGDIAPRGQDNLSYGAMGSDTAIILALLFAAVLSRRKAGRLGLAFAVLGISFTVSAFIALSYGEDLFEGQMAVTTLIALVPICTSLLTIFAHRPLMRVIFLAGPVGLRTRMTIVVGFLVPWLGGLILHRVFEVPDRSIPAEAVVIGAIILSMAIVAVASGHFHEKVDRSRRILQRQLAEMATMDHLTGTLNRTGINVELSRRWDAFRADGPSQCLILLDLDHFKSVNDRFGHDEGDAVLSAIAGLTRPYLRKSDAMSRWGGEEFLIVVEGIRREDTVALAERLRAAIESYPAKMSAGSNVQPVKPYRLTGSFGVAFFDSADDGFEQAIKRADLALYDAKAKGRNRVVFDPAAGLKAA